MSDRSREADNHGQQYLDIAEEILQCTPEAPNNPLFAPLQKEFDTLVVHHHHERIRVRIQARRIQERIQARRSKKSDERIQECLRRVTLAGLKLDRYTLKDARRDAAEELGFEEGFFKDDRVWNEGSKKIVEGVVAEHGTKLQGRTTTPDEQQQRVSPQSKTSPTDEEDDIEELSDYGYAEDTEEEQDDIEPDTDSYEAGWFTASPFRDRAREPDAIAAIRTTMEPGSLRERMKTFDALVSLSTGEEVIEVSPGSEVRDRRDILMLGRQRRTRLGWPRWSRGRNT